MANLNLVEFLTLNDEEQVVVNQLKSTIETIMDRLTENKKRISQYHNYLKYPDVNNLHAITRERIISTQSTIDADNVLLIEEIKKMDLALLIKSAINDPILNAHCYHPALDEYWNERWRKSGRNPKEKADINHKPIHEYKPQATLHTFELLKGIFIYSHYLRLKNKKEQLAESYLQLAALLRNYAALNILFKRHFMEPDGQAQALFLAQTASESYRTPGFILLAMLYYQQGRYQDALFNLIMAELLIPHSENMVNNAYQGKSIEEMIQPLLETFEAKSLIQVKVHLAELAQLPAYFVTQNLYNKAHAKVKALLAPMKTSTPLLQNTLSLETEENHSLNVSSRL